MAYPCQTHAGLPKEAEKKPGQVNCITAFKRPYLPLQHLTNKSQTDLHLTGTQLPPFTLK